MDELMNDVKRVETEVSDHSLAYEMLQEMKKTIKRLWITAIALVVALAVSVISFLVYLHQFDVVSTTEATGIYNSVDGSILTAQDVDSETWELFMDWLNTHGNDTNNNTPNP